MKKRLKIILTWGFIILIQQFGNAQANQNQRFLQKVGVIDSLYSQILNESRKIYIELPAGYNPEKNQKKYPVAFILDGEIFLPTVSEVLKYYSGGFIPEMVLVGISNEKNRIRDLTTSTIKTQYGMPYNESNGKAEIFSEFIEKELIPFVEKKLSCH